ncbi:hypothetical protein HK097_005705 [Rhizophlyctis rosea]|uniref:Glycine zipper 2TM domain-containing protein n=1 Tax=Rhizophlyctis rosea TaxID=64517 RepID=A0AAD5WY99_9FUNG|nr:hypothetical protein HK097_005705 [Rhizophlyctis rosea]
MSHDYNITSPTQALLPLGSSVVFHLRHVDAIPSRNTHHPPIPTGATSKLKDHRQMNSFVGSVGGSVAGAAVGGFFGSLAGSMVGAHVGGQLGGLDEQMRKGDLIVVGPRQKDRYLLRQMGDGSCWGEVRVGVVGRWEVCEVLSAGGGRIEWMGVVQYDVVG